MLETRMNLGNGIIKYRSFILIDEQGVPIENNWDTIKEIDKEFSWIEEELEKKLWELHDIMQNQKNS